VNSNHPGARFLAILSTALVGILPAPAAAQPAVWKPSRNIEIIAPAGPGSALDQTARALQKILQEKRLVEPAVSVANKPGGGQALGFTYLNQQPTDGHHVSIGTISLITNRITGLHPLNYADVTPIANLVAEYVVFAVRSESPLKSARDLADRLKKDPTAVSLSFSGSLGNHNHMAIGLVAKAAGADLRKLKTVVFNSGGELGAALLGGHIDVAVGGSSVFMAQVQAGRMRLLAVTSPKRLGGLLADTPTWAELGLPASFATFRGIVGPKDLAPPPLAQWEQLLRRIADSDDWRAFLKANDAESLFLGSADYRKFLDSENERIRAILTDLGLAK
jgi:putative tricarboxylic transport membrane protein